VVVNVEYGPQCVASRVGTSGRRLEQQKFISS
jgi:hypothetical protein